MCSSFSPGRQRFLQVQKICFKTFKMGEAAKALSNHRNGEMRSNKWNTEPSRFCHCFGCRVAPSSGLHGISTSHHSNWQVVRHGLPIAFVVFSQQLITFIHHSFSLTTSIFRWYLITRMSVCILNLWLRIMRSCCRSCVVVPRFVGLFWMNKNDQSFLFQDFASF